MLRGQAVNLPPWKIVTWFSRLIEMLKKVEASLEAVQAGETPDCDTLPKLSEHWGDLTRVNGDDDYEDDDGDDNEDRNTFQVITYITCK